MELRHLRYFAAVAQELHFGRAAKRIGISQPPLSQQIMALEAEIGTRLFDRSGHKVELTPAGEAMLPEAHRLLEQAERLRSIGTRLRSDARSRLRIGCVMSVMFDVLPPILDRLRVRRPDIVVTLEDSDAQHVLAGILQGRLDIGIVRAARLDPPLKGRPLMRDHYIAALPRAHPLARHAKLPLGKLAGEPLVVYARQLSPEPYDAIIAACVSAGFSPDIAYSGGSAQACLGYVACKLGVAIVPSALRTWRIPGVVYRELKTPIRTKEVSLVCNAQARAETVEPFLRSAAALFPRLK